MADRWRQYAAADPHAFPLGPWRARGAVRALGALAGFALVSACGLGPLERNDTARQTTEYIQVASSEVTTRINAPGDAVDSPLGSYLAAKFARASGDTAAAADFLGEALAADPENSDLLNDTFRVSLADGRVKDAAELAAALVKTNPRAGLANVVLAVVAVKRGNLEVALGRLNKASTRRFNALVVPMVTAWCLTGQDKPDDAIKQLAGLSKRKSFEVFRLYHTALIQDFAGRATEAEAAYREGLEASGGGGTRIAEALGNFLERGGRAEDAKAVYGEVLKDDPSDVVFSAAAERAGGGRPPEALAADAADGVAEAFFGLAGVLAQDTALEDAAIYVRLATYLRSDFPVAQALLGNILETAGRWEAAIDQYGAIDPDSPYAWTAQVRVATNLERLERTDEAIALLQKLASQRADRTDPLISLGDLYRAQEKWAEAVEEYDRAFERKVEFAENDWTLLYTRGIALERSQQWDRAEADFLRALELKPDQPLVLNYLGYSWVEQGRHLDSALEMIRKAVDLRPRDGYIVDSLGWVLYRLDRYDEAVRQLERAVELRPDDPVINDHLGDAFWRTGRLNEARFQWHRALSFEPEPDLVPAIEEKLEDGLPAVESSADGG